MSDSKSVPKSILPLREVPRSGTTKQSHFVCPIEMAQIKSDKKLLKRLRAGHRDTRKMKGRLVARESRKKLSKKIPLTGTVLDIKGAFPVKAKINFEKLRAKMQKEAAVKTIKMAS